MKELIPEIHVKVTDIEFNINCIASSLCSDFLNRNKSLPFQERIFRAFPELSERIHSGMSDENIRSTVKELFEEKYKNDHSDILNKVKEIQAKLNQVIVPALPVLFQEFNLSWKKEYGDITCYLGFYSFFPRKVISKEYWIHYLTGEEAVYKAAMHEINHFVLFEKWKSMHGYKKEREPEHPEPLWFLEELIVDPTLNTKRLQELVPYPQRAYEQFYTAVIQGSTPQEMVKRCYKEGTSPEDFLERTYRYIEDNLQELIVKCG